MARSGALLTEAQWQKIAPLLPKPPQQRKGGLPWIENRRVLEGILWILRSGARWQDMPEKFPHPSTCWRRLRDWEERGVWLKIWRMFLSELNQRQQLKWRNVTGDYFIVIGPQSILRLLGIMARRINLRHIC